MCLNGSYDHSIGVFFSRIFNNARGYIGVARKNVVTANLKDSFFSFNDGMDKVVAYIKANAKEYDLYICAQPLSMPKRVKESVIETTCAWADLDTCPPEKLLVKPTILVESSPGRYQAYWIFDEPLTPIEGQAISKAIAYHHVTDGADKSGWDLTQLLRIPGTLNHKYNTRPAVRVLEMNTARYRLSDFAAYGSLETSSDDNDELPDPIDSSPEQLLLRHGSKLSSDVWPLYFTTPEADWSKSLWALEVLLAEAGLSKEEIYYIVRHAACNKYDRDGSSPSALWKEVKKAYAYTESRKDAFGLKLHALSDLLTNEEEKTARSQKTFIEQYTDWAESQTDAAPVYHEAGAFMVLSALLASSVRVPTTFNPQGVIPNLWFMLLGDTTIVRKSTAMDMAIDLLKDVDSEIGMTNDASLEGLYAALSLRPKETSLFVRDEFSGMLEMMQKKEYYAGMIEQLTKLYDGRDIKRQLARSVIDIRSPIFIMFTGGIRSRIMQAMTRSWIDSGFLPRFLFFTAESDISRMQDLGPPNPNSIDTRINLINTLKEVKFRYNAQTYQNIGHVVTSGKTLYTATLIPEAWKRYNQLDRTMLQDALKSAEPELFTPICQRLAMSILKAAVLIAACRPENPTSQNEVEVVEDDMLCAIRYGIGWRGAAIQVAAEAGNSVMEQLLGAVLKAITKRPGVSRAHLMQSFKLTARDADQVFVTLMQRGAMRWEKLDDGVERFFPLALFQS